MASPVFHGLVGAGLAYAMAGDARLPLCMSIRKAWPFCLAGAILACLPDVDYGPGLWRGYLNTTHQQATHGLPWVLLAAAGLWLVARAWAPDRTGWRAAVFLLVVVGSHLAIDLVTEDRFAPYGIPMWAPFADGRVHAPFSVLPLWQKTAWTDLVHWANVRALAIETGLGGLFAAAAMAAKRSWTRRKAAV